MKNHPVLSCILPISLFVALDISADEPPTKPDLTSPPSAYTKELNSIVYTELDYLLWFSNQDGLHSPTVATGKSPNIDSPWSSGVKAVLGGQASHWDTRVCYTYYSTSSHDKATANIEGILTSTPSTAGIYEVGEKWNLHFNRLDLELGRKILTCRSLMLEPFFGLEGLQISQKFDLNTNTAFLDLNTGLPATDTIDSKNRNSLLSIGPRAGLKANAHIGGGFGLYGNFGANILWGTFNIKQKYQQTDYYSSSSPSALVDQTKHLSKAGTVFNADLEIGFDWRHLCQRSNLELLVKAGWEEHYYTDIVRFQDFYLQQTSLGTAAYTTNGNLTLSGFTFGILLKY